MWIMIRGGSHASDIESLGKGIRQRGNKNEYKKRNMRLGAFEKKRRDEEKRRKIM